MMESLLRLVIEGGLKSLLLLALAVGVTAALGALSARVRHRVWGATLLGLLALPLISLLVPTWSLPVGLPPGWATQSMVAPPTKVSAAEQGDPSARIQVGTSSGALAQPSHPLAEPTGGGTIGPARNGKAGGGLVPVEESPAIRALPTVVIVLWLTGGVLVALWFGWGHWRIHRLGRRARPASTWWRAQLRRVADRLDVPRGVDVRVAPGARSPLTWGGRRPIVLLPEEADGWSEERRTLTLEHELLHVKRRDWLWEVVAQAACVMYWFNPLVWVAARRHALEREHACDEAVLAAGATPSVYAAHLLTVARQFTQPAATPSVGMAGHSKLEVRLVWIHKMSRRPRSTPRLGVVSLIVLAVVALLAGAEPWSAPDGPRAAGPDPKSGTVARVQVAGDDTVSVVVIDGQVTGRAAVALIEGTNVRRISLGDEGDTIFVLGSDSTLATGDVLILDPDGGGVNTLPADSLDGNVFAIGSDGEIRTIDAGEDDLVIFDTDTDEFVVATEEHTVFSGRDVLLCLQDGLVYAQDSRIRRIGEGPIILDHEDAVDIQELDTDALHVDPTGHLTRGGNDVTRGDGLIVRTRDGHTLRLESTPVLVTADGDIVHTRVTGRVIVDPTHPDGIIPDPGSSVVFETDGGDRRLEVSAGTDGAIGMTWSVDGVTGDAETEGREFLRAIVDLCGED